MIMSIKSVIAVIVGRRWGNIDMGVCVCGMRRRG